MVQLSVAGQQVTGHGCSRSAFRTTLPGSGIEFEIRACQIVKQHFATHIKESFPALTQVTKERLPMLKELVEAVIEGFFFGNTTSRPRRSLNAVCRYHS